MVAGTWTVSVDGLARLPHVGQMGQARKYAEVYHWLIIREVVIEPGDGGGADFT